MEQHSPRPEMADDSAITSTDCRYWPAHVLVVAFGSTPRQLQIEAVGDDLRQLRQLCPGYLLYAFKTPPNI